MVKDGGQIMESSWNVIVLKHDHHTPIPNTGRGIEATIAPILGIKPHIIIITPAMVTTCLDIMPVIPTIPTFWLNEVFGSPPKTPATAVPRPSA